MTGNTKPDAPGENESQNQNNFSVNEFQQGGASLLSFQCRMLISNRSK